MWPRDTYHPGDTTHGCGALQEAGEIGAQVTIAGWVREARVFDGGRIVQVRLYDTQSRWGFTPCLFTRPGEGVDEAAAAAANERLERARNLAPDTVVRVTGTLRAAGGYELRFRKKLLPEDIIGLITQFSGEFDVAVTNLEELDYRHTSERCVVVAEDPATMFAFRKVERLPFSPQVGRAEVWAVLAPKLVPFDSCAQCGTAGCTII